MPLFRFFIQIFLSVCLVACVPSIEPDFPICGDDICENSEDSQICLEDCGQSTVSGKILATYIYSEGIGNIGVLLAYPINPRFEGGAGVIVVVPPFLTEEKGFSTKLDFTTVGLIQVSFLWPGQEDVEHGVQSEGENDYGGEFAMQAFRDVLNFVTGRMPNTDGRLITTLLPVKPFVDEVGIYAYSHAGLAVTNVLSLYGDLLKGITYFVGFENPTVDTLICLETGYRDTFNSVVINPFYQYPQTYSPTEIKLNFNTLHWDDNFQDGSSSITGRPYLDIDGNDSLNEGDFLFSGQVPVIEGKQYYSTELIQSFLENGNLSLETWPLTLATPEEAFDFWAFRQAPFRYGSLVLQAPNLKVMLVFARDDHAQAAIDKPHIHQAFQGFRFTGLLRWVRLNPDRSYLQSISSSSVHFADNPANTQPENWNEIGNWAFSEDNISWELASLAALAEMSDRTHAGRWDENLGTVLYEYSSHTQIP